jgi:hypothetical protein
MNTSTTNLATDFAARVRAYANTAEGNDRVYAEFTALTAADPLLAAHRGYIETRRLGFGDPAFHALWRGLLAMAHACFGSVDALEIGVFKGQVISLWALLARHYGWGVRVHAISPLEGQPMPPQGWWRSLRYRLSPRFRERVDTGNFHAKENYEAIIRELFTAHALDFADVRLVRGYSTAPAVRAAVAADRFHLVYIDGDHTFAGALADIEHYAPKVVPGGWLVMDDAAYGLPGTTFWKGYETVARACSHLPALGFDNVINVGHNCVFQRRA